MAKLRYFVLAAALLASVSSAHAELQELARSGAWRAVADKSGDTPVCAMEAYSYSDHRMLMIKWARGTTSMSVHLYKPNWIIPERTELTLKIQFDGVVSFRGIVTAVDRRAAELLQGRSIEGWIRNDNGNGNGSYDVQKSFINQFMAADKMYVLFPDGNEPAWTMNMDGSEKIARAWGKAR
jgi:hypothetical protein